jgi:hypothetical protein
MAKTNYLSNKQLLKEIHRSKRSYCEFTAPHYHQYDVIVEELDEIFEPETIKLARKNKAARLAQANHKAAVEAHTGSPSAKPRLIDHKIDPTTLAADELVYRVIDYTHIPLEPGRKKNPRKEAEHYARLNFIPFKHYVVKDGKAIEVGRSHCQNGEFCQTHGAMTDTLARMFMLLVERYSQRSNWRAYTYLDEMKGQSLLQLSSMGLQFNEYKSDNPFAYYTAAISNTFTRVLNIEKKNQNVRDEILISRGQTPSFSKQIQYEEGLRLLRESNIENED